MKRALCIAGSDSGGGAGVQADLKTFAAHGVFGMSAITAITAQNTLGVQGVLEVPPDFVALQIDSVMQDLGADAVKIGMLSNSGIVEIVAAKLKEYQVSAIVLDPVMLAKSGDPLLKPEARDSLIARLLPLATVITPNIPEAEAIWGRRISGLEEMKEAARAIQALGPKAVIVKGGHDEDRGKSRDVFFDGKEIIILSADRIESKNTHGTGCSFAAALAANLALGRPLQEAASAAKDYVTSIIRASVNLGLGSGHGPMNHMAGLINIQAH